MKPLGAALALLVLALAPLATAEYGSGSTLEADAPVTLEGRVDALVPKGLVSYVSAEGGDLLLSLKAPEMEVRFVTASPACVPAGVTACSPTSVTGPQATEEVHQLRDASLSIVRPLGAFKAVVTNDAEAYSGTSSFGTPGALVTTTSAGTLLTTRASDRHLSPFQDDWNEQGPTTGGATGDVYTAAGGQGQVEAPGGALRGAGGFQLLLQGVKVKVKGTEDGQPFEKEFDAPVARDAGEPTRYLTVQTPLGMLSATSAKAPLLVHGVSLAETNGRATFEAARGEVVEDGATTPYDGEDVTLQGPLSLTLTKVVKGDPMRLAFGLGSTLRIADALPLPEEEKDADTTALVAAGAAGAGGAGLLAAIAYFWPRLKFGATLLFLPLYSRIERTAVLEHEKRDEIYGLIRATPGIHAHEIGEKAQIGWGTTVYHLKLLEQHSLIVSQKSGRYKRFFVNTGEYTKKKDVYGALRNETAKAVAQYIVDHPGVTQKELCAALGIQPSLASWHVEKLEGVELVKRVKDGRMVRYFAGPAWSHLNIRIDARGGAEGVAET